MNIKKTWRRLLPLVLVLALCITSLVVPAAAAEDAAVNVRVNGYLVNFPDQKPIVDKNDRTLIPVRFVAEELGADVSWDGKLNAAVIEKDGLTITVPIGSKELTVTDASGKTTNVAMDTEAVLENSRTLVPIRFVAEAMGAWVSYSSSFRTVQIYDDVLTPEEINELHSIPFDWDFNASKLKYKNSATTFEDLNECSFTEVVFKSYSSNGITLKNVYDGQVWNSKKDSCEELTNMYVRFARNSVAELFTSKEYGVKATYRTDASCVFTSPASTAEGGADIIYGYLTITFDKDADIARYKKRFSGADFGNIQPGKSYTYIIESRWMLNVVAKIPQQMGVWNRTNGISDNWA
ncbi:MAG: copper amine oxidase N-terminal domain-containing protein [Oscillospiraceae bacterium]